MSPSVNTPVNMPSSSTIIAMPNFFSEISSITSAKLSVSLAIGSFSGSVNIKSATLYVKPFPKAPDGWKIRKSSFVNPRFSSKHTAKASPIARVAVVLAVGALFNGQASFSTEISNVTSDE